MVYFELKFWDSCVIAGAKNKGSHLTHRSDSHITQNLSAGDSIIVEDHSEMDRRSDLRYSCMNMHQSTPGVRYFTPVGSSLQTPFDGRISASQHFNMAPSHNFHSRDASHLRPPNHFLNPMSGAHSMPDLEATPFQAIANPLDNGHRVMHGSMTTLRPYSWHMTPVADAFGIGKTPSFRRTPGARRSSPRVPHGCQPMPEPHSSFQPTSYCQAGMHSSIAALPVHEFLENDARRAPSVSSASSYPSSVRSRSNTEPARFDTGSNVTDGVELVVSNLDYNISSHEWKKILTCEMQQQVQV